ncbi:MAG: restriction endonuclease subunit S [Chitinophagales bacterium]
MKEVKLSSLCNISSGGTPRRGHPEYYGGNIPWAKIRDIEKSDGIITETEEYITKEGLKNIRNRIFPKGTLLFSMYGSIGKVAFAGTELSTNQAILGINVKEESKDELSLDYLKCWFQMSLVFLKNRAVGGILKNLSATIVKNLKIPLPSLTDQKRIAYVLSSCESLIAKRKESIALLDEFLKSTFLEMFGDSLNENLKKLSEVCEKITDGTHDTPKRITKGVPFITGKHIRPYYIDFTNSDFVSKEDHIDIFKRCNPSYGDVLYTNIGVNLGTAAYNNVEYEFSMKNVALFKLKNKLIVGRFLEHLLNNERIKNNILRTGSTGGAQKFLSLTKIRNLKIPVPAIQKQNEFTEIVQKTEKLKAQYASSLLELEQLYGSISQKAFAGELDLSQIQFYEEEQYSASDNDRTEPKIIEPEISIVVKKKEAKKIGIETKKLEWEFDETSENIEKEDKIDITNLSLADYFGIPEEIQNSRENIEMEFISSDLFYQFFLKDTFTKGELFTITEIEDKFSFNMEKPDYEDWKDIVFKFIEQEPALIEQEFEPESATLKLKLTDEAFKA